MYRQVKCKEVRSIDNLHVQLQESSTTSEPNQDSESTCSIKIKDAYLPPWIIRSVCDALESNGGDFEARYDKLNFIDAWMMDVNLLTVISYMFGSYHDFGLLQFHDRAHVSWFEHCY